MERNDLHPVSHLTNESTISDCQPKPSDQEVLDVNVSNEIGSSEPVCTMFMRLDMYSKKLHVPYIFFSSFQI